MSDSALHAWFLGPKAENADLLERLILEALRDCIYWRKNFHPEDEALIDERAKREDGFQDSVSLLQQELINLLANLKRDIPFYSPRYAGHMLGEQLLPALVGYFAAMLHNPNNVSTEGSPTTSKLEREVADQLARMLGYGAGTWGHISSGGTVANCEAIWVARNLTFLPLAAHEVAAELGLTVEVRLPDGRSSHLASMEDPWPLLNLDADEILELRDRMCARYRELQAAEAAQKIDEMLAERSISGKGLHRYFADHPWRDQLEPGCVLMPTTAHYSLIKAIELLGIGRGQIEFVPVDDHFRMDMRSLEEALDACLMRRRSVLAVISILGNTEEGAVDHIHEIERIRNDFRKKGLTFYHHCDGAWGGYVRTLLFDAEGHQVSEPGSIMRELRVWPPDDVFRSFQAVPQTDSVTVDPHKLGYVPYPCGAIIFRNQKAKEMIRSDEGQYIFRTGEASENTVGRFILEGSKPGAAAAACWLAHKVVPLNQSGYGLLVGKSIQGAQELNLKCRDLADVLSRRKIILRVLTDPPDMNLFCFVVNGQDNGSLSEMNRLNEAVYDRLRFKPDEVIQRHAFIISTTDFGFAQYGRRTAAGKGSMEGHLSAMGIETAVEQFRQVGRVRVLRSTITSPWIALSRGKNPDYVQEFADTLERSIIAVFEGE